MFTIAIFERSLGPDQRAIRKGALAFSIQDHANAVRRVEAFIADFTVKGWNDEQGYWWCRNEGDPVTTILVITSDVLL
jgi:hypothetical protein